MVQTTTAHLLLDGVDSGSVILDPAQRQAIVGGSFTKCTDSRIYRIATGSHYTVVLASGSCSGAFTSLDQQRPYPGKDTTYVGIETGNC